MFNVHPESDLQLDSRAAGEGSYNSERCVDGKIDFRAIIETVCINSPAELLAVKEDYQARFERSLEDAVASNCSGDLRKVI